jgi:hypothetical protein
MGFLHSDFNIGPDDTVQVTLDKQANVLLLDDGNFSNYRGGRRFSYFGGLAKQSPVRLSPPHSGHWHVVVDLGGYAGSVRASIVLL